MSETHEEDHEEEGNILQEEWLPKEKIYEGSESGAHDAVTIHLDGKVQSDLNWKGAREQAEKARERGLKVLWALDLGLFESLQQPLTNQGQFLTLTLSLEHFRDSLWQEFKDCTLGVSLFRGDADFRKGFSWDSHQEENFMTWLQENCSIDASGWDEIEEREPLIRLFCRDVSVEYLNLLAGRLPDNLPLFLFLDLSSFEGSRQEELHYMNPERFERFRLALKNAHLPFEALKWAETTERLTSDDLIQVGICVPPMSFNRATHYEGFEQALIELEKAKLPYKLIPEHALTANWDGLDYLLYSPTGLSPQGKRKLQGFCAAGGTVISTGRLLGFSQELSFSEWFDKECA